MKFTRQIILITIQLGLIIAFAHTPAPAYAQSGLIVSAEAGLDGYCKPETWLPVRIKIENSGSSIEGELYAAVEENNNDWSFNTQVSIPSASRKEFTIYLHTPAYRLNVIEVGLVSEGEVVNRQQVSVNCVQQTDKLIGIWAQNPSLFNQQIDTNVSGIRSTLLLLDENTIPERAEGLAMLSTLTVSNVDAGSLSAAQREALAGWIKNGGKLLITGGPNWTATAIQWGFELPFVPESTISMPDLSALSSLSPGAGLPVGSAAVAIGMKARDANVVAGSLETPLILSRKSGFGTISYMTIDPTLEPLRAWPGMNDVYRHIFSETADVPPWSSGFSEWDSANNALNTIDSLGMPPFLLICGFILLYITIVGPLNFFILRRINQRDAAWITVPVIVILFTGAVLLISSSILGDRPIINRLTLVQAWEGQEDAAVHGLIGVFSPGRETFSLAMEDHYIASPIPNTGFGSDGWNHVIRQTDSGFEVPALNVDVGGLEGVFVSGKTKAPSIITALDVETSPLGNPRLVGSITNNSDMSLREVTLLSSALPVQIGDLNPGETVLVDTSFIGSNAVAGNPALFPGGYAPYGADSTLTDLFGTNYIYPSNSISAETYRRFNLISAALGGNYGSRGGGTYLIGWTDTAPFETNLAGFKPDTSDTTVYVFQIQPGYIYEAGPGETLNIPPGMFAWTVLGSPSGSVTANPYEGYLNTGDFAISYTPISSIEFAQVKNLTMHLESYGAAGQVEFNIYLWDFQQNRWSQPPGIGWGDTNIQNPERFVDADGEIRLKLENQSALSISIEKADFTLELER